jgi:hypothetical protein
MEERIILGSFLSNPSFPYERACYARDHALNRF